MISALVRTAGATVAFAAVVTLAGCWSSDNEILYDGPREALVHACGRAAISSSLVEQRGRLIVENVTVSDADTRAPIVSGELEVQHWGGGESRYVWTCAIPDGDDYLAAEITSLVAIEEG